MTVSPVRLNHAVLFVSDLDRSVAFYEAALGLQVVDRQDRFGAAFLRSPRSGNHHDLGLFGVPGSGPRRPGVGLYHLAWQVDTIEELVEVRAQLAAVGGLTGESSHGATKSAYGADPDGNQLEVMWMLPREAWGPYADKAVVEPLDLAAEVAQWSGTRTAGRVVAEAS